MKTQPLQSSGAFAGSNFMTPILIGYRSGDLNGQRVHVELSEERDGGSTFARMFHGDSDASPLVGVTIRRPSGERLDPDPSTVCGSRKEAEEYLESLGKESAHE